MKVVLAGAGGDLGARIAKALRGKGAEVRAMARSDYQTHAALTKACEGAACVVSAVNGLREVMVDRQSALLDAALRAGVPRFIPSDYSIDFRQIATGQNRNFDLRKDFHSRLDRAAIQSTSIFNGAFADMLTGQAPFVIFKIKRVPFWRSADQELDFTTKDNVAAFTASAALDASSPRALHIAGDRLTARGLAALCSRLSGEPYKLLRAGSLGSLSFMIKVMKTLMPAPNDPFPPWQGMQYFHNMYSGEVASPALDNDRYTGIVWTPVAEVLAPRLSRK